MGGGTWGGMPRSSRRERGPVVGVVNPRSRGAMPQSWWVDGGPGDASEQVGGLTPHSLILTPYGPSYPSLLTH